MPSRRTPEGIGRRDFARLSLGTLGAAVVDEVVDYQGIYRLCYLRGPEGILIGLAEELGQKTGREDPLKPKG